MNNDLDDDCREHNEDEGRWFQPKPAGVFYIFLWRSTFYLPRFIVSTLVRLINYCNWSVYDVVNLCSTLIGSTKSRNYRGTRFHLITAWTSIVSTPEQHSGAQVELAKSTGMNILTGVTIMDWLKLVTRMIQQSKMLVSCCIDRIRKIGWL